MQDQNRKALIWIVAVSTITLTLIVGVLIMPVNNARWNAMTKRVTQLQNEARTRNVSRPVLRGEPSPGNAWDEYTLALNETFNFKEDQNAANLTRFNNRQENADRAMVERLIAAHPGVIDHLRLGASRANGQYPYHWELGPEATLPSLLASRRTTQLAIAQARIWEESGRAQDAADLLLDTSQFASDLASNGVLLSSLAGIGVYTSTLDGLRNLVLSGKLSRQELATLAKRLEIADRNFPLLGPAFTNEATMSGIASEMPGLEPSISEWLLLAKEGGWRYGLTPQRMSLDAFEQRDLHAQRTHNIDNLPFDVATKEAEAITAETTSSGNPLVRMFEPGLTRALATHREALARLRLLRAATTFLATGETVEIADPFGRNLYYEQKNGKLKIWSNGRDGENQNGQGTWSQDQSKDLVLEIPK